MAVGVLSLGSYLERVLPWLNVDSLHKIISVRPVLTGWQSKTKEVARTLGNAAHLLDERRVVCARAEIFGF
jgi:hypothetical protein